MKPLVIGSRGSALALWQAEHIKRRLKDELGLDSSIAIIKTKGDKILDVPLAKVGGKGLFTKELEEQLLNKSIDLAVHSLKDVPVVLESSLSLVAITKRANYSDCLLSMKYDSLESLPQGAKVGTTSLRRAMQLNMQRNDLDTLSLRGNVQTRIARLKEGVFDAIILAKAGLERLNIDTSEITHITTLESMIPAMGQGALGVEMLSSHAMTETIARLNDDTTCLCVSAERAFVRELNGGCQVPIGVCAEFSDNELHLRAILGLPNGKEILADSAKANVSLQDIKGAEALGVSLAQSFIEKGALPLLQKAAQMAFA